MNGFNEFCPPLGLPTERFNVQVMGSHSPPVGGCASMQTIHHDVIPAFNLWLGNVQNGGGSCDETGMYNELFYCYSTMVRRGSSAAFATPESFSRLKTCVY
jgi:hypothetical protein